MLRKLIIRLTSTYDTKFQCSVTSVLILILATNNNNLKIHHVTYVTEYVPGMAVLHTRLICEGKVQSGISV